MDQNPPAAGRGPRDIRGDKRKEETVMLSGENVADLVAQARAEASAASAPDPAPATTSSGPNRTVLLGGAAALIVVVLLVVLFVL